MKFFILLMMSQLSIASIIPADYKKKESKIDKVTVYSDRALVSRTINGLDSDWIKVEALPSNIDKNSIKVSAINANNKAIKQIIIGDSFYKKTLPVDVDDKLVQLEKLYLKKLTIEQKLYLITLENNFLNGIQYESPYTSDSQNFLIFEATTKTLNQSLGEIANSELKNHLEQEKLKEEVSGLEDEIRVLKSELAQSDSRRSQKWLTDVFINIDRKQMKKKSALNLSYYITNAHWIPQYDVRCDLDLRSGKANINLISFGKVKNETGEDWKDVNVTLSSIDPTPLYLPKLNRWLFSEKREELSVKESGAGVFGGMMADAVMESAPAPMQAKRSMKKAKRVSKRRARSKGFARTEGFADEAMEEDYVIAAPSRKMDKNPRNTNKIGNSFNSLFTTSKLSSVYRDLLNNINIVKQNKKIESKFRPYYAINTNIKPEKRYLSSNLPAMQANGRKLEFKSPFKFSLESHKEPNRIPTTTTSLSGDLKYLLIPKKDKKAYVRTRVTNLSGQPILGGEANIYLDGDLTSKTKIITTNENATMLFDLGIDETVETKRIVKKKSEKEGMLFKKHQVIMTVEIEVVNNHNFPIDIELKDNYPLTSNEEVEVKLKDINPKPIQKKFGIIVWNKKIAAGAKEKFTFKYRVTHPENFIIKDYDL